MIVLFYVKCSRSVKCNSMSRVEVYEEIELFVFDDIRLYEGWYAVQ